MIQDSTPKYLPQRSENMSTENLYMSVYSSSIHNSQTGKRTQVSIK